MLLKILFVVSTTGIQFLQVPTYMMWWVMTSSIVTTGLTVWWSKLKVVCCLSSNPVWWRVWLKPSVVSGGASAIVRGHECGHQDDINLLRANDSAISVPLLRSNVSTEPLMSLLFTLYSSVEKSSPRGLSDLYLPRDRLSACPTRWTRS